MGLFDKNKTYSVEFCSDEVRVVEGRYNKKNIVVNKVFSIPIPEGVYEDGMIRDMEELSQILHKEFSLRNISGGEVYGVINSSNIIIREIRIPKVDVKQIASILNYQLDEYLPVDPEGYVVQFVPLDVVYDEGVEKLNVMLIGVPKYMVETHLNLIRNIGLKPVVLDYAGNAMSKLIHLSDSINGVYGNDITIACVDLEQKSTALCITGNGMMSMSRVVNAEINPAVYDNQSGAASYSDEQDAAVAVALQSDLSAVLNGIDMVFRYYNSRNAQRDIDLVLIYGNYSNINGIEEVMSSYLDKPCVKLSVLDKVKFLGDIAKYANAIGALIRGNGVK